MPSKASDLFTRVAQRCPLTPGSPAWAKWIEDELKKLETLEADLHALSLQKQQLKAQYNSELKKLNAKLEKLQELCVHEMHRGTAECDPVCRICGYHTPCLRSGRQLGVYDG